MTVTRSGIEDQRQRDEIHLANLTHRETFHRQLEQQTLTQFHIRMHRAQMRRVNIAIVAGIANLIALLLISMR